MMMLSVATYKINIEVGLTFVHKRADLVFNEVK